MQAATLEEVQSNLPELLEELSTKGELIITREGKPIGRLLPPELPKGVPIYGRGKGMVIQMIDDEEHLKDFAEYMP